MYNRYLSGDTMPEEQLREEPLSVCETVSTPPPAIEKTCPKAPEKNPGDLPGLLSGFLRGLHFDTDDLLLLAIIWLLVRDSDDNDVLLIVAALFFMGWFKT